LEGDLVAAHLLVLRALELAGKRNRNQNRALRGQYAGIDFRTAHEHIRIHPDQLPKLLAGAFDWCEEVAGLVALDPGRLRAELTEYVGGLLLSGQPHSTAYLSAVVRKARQ
jgi:hypothetical protein